MARPSPTLAVLALLLPLGSAETARAAKCPRDAVPVGSVCVDKYEASVWQIDPANKPLVKKVRSGKATAAELAAGGATQLAPAGNCIPYPAGFPSTGQWTPVAGSAPPSPGVYAASLPGVQPSTCITWFQAAQACRLSGKRLLTNLEWQDAAAGTPDPGNEDDGASECHVSGEEQGATGARASCVSSWGAFDMIGNASEWVADWADLCTTPTDTAAELGSLFEAASDRLCIGGDGSRPIPAPLVRGGTSGDLAAAGAFAAETQLPTLYASNLGFRCAR